MPSIITTFFPTLFILITFLLILCFFAPQQVAAWHLLQQSSSSQPSPKLKLTASEPQSSLYEPMMFRSQPSFQRWPLFPPRLIPALPRVPNRPTMPTITSFPAGLNLPGIPGIPPPVPLTPPPPSYDLSSSENSPEKNEDDKKAPDFPQQ